MKRQRGVTSFSFNPIAFTLIALTLLCLSPVTNAQDKAAAPSLDGVVKEINEGSKPLQVFLEVNIFEVLLNDSTDIGFVYDLLGEVGDFRGTNLAGDPVIESDLGVLQSQNRNLLLPSGANVVGRIFEGDNGEVLATIQALSEDQMVRVHANPILLTLSGYTAKLQAGDDIPFLNRINLGDAITVETLFKETGVTLQITPWVVFSEIDIEKKDPFIYLNIDASLNSVTRFREEEGFLQPITDTRQYKSSIWLKSDERVLIGSVFKDSKFDSIRGIPLLMDIPILGRFFRGTSENSSISQLFIMIRPGVFDVWADDSSLMPLEQQSKIIREFLKSKTLDIDQRPDPIGDLRDLFLDDAAPEQ